MGFLRKDAWARVGLSVCAGALGGRVHDWLIVITFIKQDVRAPVTMHSQICFISYPEKLYL